MVNEILGGKDHMAVFINEYNLGNTPDNATWRYPGILKEPKITPGLQINTLTGIGSRYPQGWAKEGYIPELSISGQVAGPWFYNLLEPHLKGSLEDNYSSQAWEIYRDKPSGYNGALVGGALAKTITLTKNGFSTPLEFSLALIGKYIELTTSFSGGKAHYHGFKGSASNPIDIAHGAIEPIPWLGAHATEKIKYSGSAESTLDLIRNWSLSINREIEPYQGKETGDDGAVYTVVRAFSWQKATAVMNITLGSKGWDIWERAFRGDLIDYLDIYLTPPAGLSTNPGNKKIRLSDGIVKPVDLDIKEMAALDIPLTLEFKGVSLS